MRQVAWCWVSALVVLLASSAMADDIGITNARLLENDDGVYVLEVEAHPNVVGWITPPVFPDRFELLDVPEPEWQRSIVTLRYVLSSPSGPLRADDVVILPWQRSAALVTVRWADGTVRRGLFTRGLGGIRVPIAELRDEPHDAVTVAMRHHRSGASHVRSRWPAHALLIVGLALALRFRTAMVRVAAYAGGLAAAMVAVDVGSSTVPGDLAAAGVCLGAMLLARSAVRDDLPAATWLAVAIGVIDGLGIAGTIAPGESRVAAMFGADIAVVAMTAIATAGLSGVLIRVRDRPRRFVAYGIGTLATATMLILTLGPVRTEATVDAGAEFDLGRAIEPGAGAVSLPPTRPPSTPTDPVTLFVTVEPAEVRVEALVRVQDWVDARGSLSIEDQPATTEHLAGVVARGVEITIDGVAVEAATSRTDFVAVGPFGVQTRAEPIAEPIDDALLGVTLAFPISQPPTAVDIAWIGFDETVARVPATWSDPTATGETVLTADAPTLAWQGDISAFAPPPVRAVLVTPPRWPVLSLVLAVLAAAGLATARRRPRIAMTAWVLLTAAAVAYPFARTPVGLPGLTTGTPDADTTARIVQPLLTNVYRAFDVRAEEAIYDRLAISVTGEQLTDAYLEHRRALELENRGGARARVDDVDVLHVRSVRPRDGGGFVADVAWTVSGSVGHFGHVHYRRNRYRADVAVAPDGDSWKLADVEIRDERRIL